MKLVLLYSLVLLCIVQVNGTHAVSDEEEIRDRYTEWWIRFEDGFPYNTLAPYDHDYYEDLTKEFLTDDIIHYPSTNLSTAIVNRTSFMNVLDAIINGTNPFDAVELHLCLRPYVCFQDSKHALSVCNDYIASHNRVYSGSVEASVRYIGRKYHAWKKQNNKWKIEKSAFINSGIKPEPLDSYGSWNWLPAFDFNECAVPHFGF